MAKLTLFVHFFAVTARLRRKNARAQDNDFLYLFLNFDTVF